MSMNASDPFNHEDKDMEMLRKHLSALSEVFDSVQIFTTRFLPDGNTMTASKGSGNWYSRYGQVKEWCIKQDEETRKSVRSDE